MSKNETFVGFTDTGQPLVLGGGRCEHFRPCKNRLLNEESCWYCRYADFRKTVDMSLAQSICRCPDNRMGILWGCENEGMEQNGGTKQ